MAFKLLVKGTVLCNGNKEKAKNIFNSIKIESAAKQAIKAGF
jgi:hypothetical protein